MWSTPAMPQSVAFGVALEVHEVAHPQVLPGGGPAEQDGGVVGRGDGGQVGLAGAAAARQQGGAQVLGAGGGAVGVGALHAQGRHPRVVAGVAVAVVEQHARVALAPLVHRLGPVRAHVGEAHGLQHLGRPVAGGRAHGQLGEREALGARGGRHGGGAHLLAQGQQRAARVDGDAVGLGLAEVVVEDLQRPRPVVARGLHVAHEGGQVEPALAREAAVVAAPLEHVHAQHGRVGQLQEEDLVAGDALDLRRVAAAREDVERVQAGAQRGMVRALHDRPGVAVVADVPPPGQRLEGDPHAVAAAPPRPAGAAGPPTARGRRWRPAPRWSRPAGCPRPARP